MLCHCQYTICFVYKYIDRYLTMVLLCDRERRETGEKRVTQGGREDLVLMV